MAQQDDIIVIHKTIITKKRKVCIFQSLCFLLWNKIIHAQNINVCACACVCVCVCERERRQQKREREGERERERESYSRLGGCYTQIQSYRGDICEHIHPNSHHKHVEARVV